MKEEEQAIKQIEQLPSEGTYIIRFPNEGRQTKLNFLKLFFIFENGPFEIISLDKLQEILNKTLKLKESTN